MQTNYELVIIGGGPIGLACGLEAKKAGLSYIILEKGCLVNSIYNYPVNMTFFSTSDKLEIGGIPFITTSVKPNRPEALEYYRRVALSRQLNIHLQEKVLRITPKDNLYEVISERQTYCGTYVVIATGFYDVPVKLDIPGEDLPKVTHYYKEPHPYAMQKVVVVGASNSAVDAALETYRKGADVTMVIKGDAIGPRVKYWVKPDIENRIKEGSIKAFFHSTLTAIHNDTVDILNPGGPISIPNDFVIAMTGYQPQFEFLRSCGINLAGDGSLLPSYNPETMQTNMKNIYLAGVVCGGMNTHEWFIENSRVHAEIILADIVSRRPV